ncbi:DUF2894 domain-containing protein [Marinobacter fonticola]|uniref:DUF2894 domain-containing protein n=1 Tax=Marinobacter fonticola TaxID=2603215 RepID=UPI00143DD575|nr:DUF2894 domain-containing protein [Marinobacter fonticola]
MTTETATHESPRQRLDRLRHASQQAVDPVRFRYLDALERRLRERDLQHGRHWVKLQQALDDYERTHLRTTPRVSDRHPSPVSLAPLSQLSDLLNGQSPAATAESTSPLAELFAGDGAEPADTAPAYSPRPLKAVMRARALQSERTLERRIQSAIEQSPENAGPMNAHRLVSRAVGELKRLSPDYLKRFASYTDLLQSLERLNIKG